MAAVYPSSLLLSLFQTQSPGSLTPFWQFLEEGMEALSHGATAKSAVSMSRDTFSGAVNGPDGDHVKRKKRNSLTLMDTPKTYKDCATTNAASIAPK